MTLLNYCEIMVRKIFSSRRDKTHAIRGISQSKVLPRWRGREDWEAVHFYITLDNVCIVVLLLELVKWWI
jgi:hypothetical protein